MSATKTELATPRGLERQSQADQSQRVVPADRPIARRHRYYTFIIAREKEMTVYK